MAYYTWKSFKLRIEPEAIFEVFSKEKHCFFLDSSLTPHALSRYSFLGIEPFLIIESKCNSPFKKLRKVLNAFSLSVPGNTIPFLAGAVGFLSYDLGFGLEKKIHTRDKLDTGIADCFFGLYNASLIIDHRKKMLHIFAVGFPEKKSHYAKLLAQDNLKKISAILSCAALRKRAKAKKLLESPLNLRSNFSKAEYIRAVKRAKEYIRRGDIYQVNLSQEFSVEANASAQKIYQRLRSFSPSSFSSYFDAGNYQILSSSPERFLKIEGDTISTRPMKGTRSRGQTRPEDKRLKQELLKSAKDRAELMMIVDLERNDLGRVCDYDSVRVSALRNLEPYRTVFQTTATVCGRLHKDKDRIDALRACFPGGSITGCPKIRAMEIIEELEPQRRGIYTGCFGYLSFHQTMDFSILIRTILKKENQLSFGVGGGIVADSEPQDEYEETLVKAQGMMKAISSSRLPKVT